MKKLFFAILFIFPLGVFAQIEKEMKDFENFVRQQQKEFTDFIEEQNKEFAAFLKEHWKEYDLETPVERPKKPEPVTPILFDTTKPIAPAQETPVGEVSKLPIPDIPLPTPIADQPINKPEEKQPIIAPTKGINFSFYGLQCCVSETLKNSLSLNSIKEKDISKGWETLSKSNYKPLINDCMAIKEQYALNDWGYLLLSKHVSEALCGKYNDNEIALMQMFILCQSGYKTKVARAGNKLILLYTTDNNIYGVSFVKLQGVPHYMFNHQSAIGESIYTYNKDFASSTRLVNMNIANYQPFNNGDIRKKTLQAKGHPVKLQSNVNTGLISFYKDYPQCDFSVYVTAPVSQEVEQSVLPPLKEAIQGKSEVEAANILINFVQTAFEYQTDDEQFGYEKPFFVEELFFYPYSDCEDRAVLYSYLMRTLTGLDVVLLDYPEHIATAVRFNVPVNGDYVMVGNQKYTICDPTYIGASIGQAMPQFKNVPVKVLKY